MARYTILILVIFLGLVSGADAQTDWAAEYNRLSQIIKERAPEPRGSPKQLEPYLSWMEIKAGDRDEVDALLQELNMLSIQDPDNQQIAQWTQKFFELSKKAQASGDGTVWEAASMFMRWGHGTRNSQWPSVISELNDKGRKIYQKAQETRFDTHVVKEKAMCMIRFSTADIEIGDLAIWFNREAFLGWTDEQGFDHMPTGDFDVECSRRADQTVTAEGRPVFPVDQAFEKTKMIRDEAEWWQFGPERKDVIDLENDYYKDALCEEPPHKQKMGHGWFKEQAEERELDESVEHNKGFYATLYGNVQVRMPDGDEPAPGAKVTVQSGDETWSATADGDGNYEIKRIILHEECSPHDISASYEGDRVDDTYEGPLEEPDTNARHRKDLLIIPSAIYAWRGTLTIGSNKELHCEAQKEDDNSERSLSRHESWAQRATLQVYGEDIRETAAGFDMNMGKKMHVTGTMMGRITNSREQYTRSKKADRRILERSSSKGSSTTDIDDKNLFIHITREMPSMSPESMQDLAWQVQQGKISPQEFQEKLTGMSPTRKENEFDVVVMVQVMVAGKGQIRRTDYRSVYDRGESRVERDSSETVEMPISMPLKVRLAGKYTKGKDGRATISASVNEKQVGPPGGVWDCPDTVTYTTGSLNLSRTKQKKK